MREAYHIATARSGNRLGYKLPLCSSFCLLKCCLVPGKGGYPLILGVLPYICLFSLVENIYPKSLRTHYSCWMISSGSAASQPCARTFNLERNACCLNFLPRHWILLGKGLYMGWVIQNNITKKWNIWKKHHFLPNVLAILMAVTLGFPTSRGSYWIQMNSHFSYAASN